MLKVIYKGGYFGEEEIMEGVIDKFLDYGVKEGSLVACILNSPMKIISVWLAILKIKAIPVFIPGYFSSHMLEGIRKNLRVDFTVEEINDDLIINNNNNSILKVEPNSIIFASSASTGEPKLIMKTKEKLDAEFERYREALDLKSTDVFLSMVPLYHAYGFMCSLYTAQKLGATVVVPHTLFPRGIISLLKKHNVTIIYGVPELYQKLLLLDVSTLPDSLRYAFSSSAPVSNELLLEFRKKFHFSLTQQYGSTETGSVAISKSDDLKNEFSMSFRNIEYKLELFGQEEELYEILIDSKDTIGTYIFNNKLQYIEPGIYRTSDYGQCVDGKLIISGRIKDIVNIAGRKISKKYMESVMKKYPYLIFAKIEDESNGLSCRYKLYDKEKIMEFKEFCKKELPSFSMPQKFIWMDDLENILTWKEGIKWGI